MRIISKILTLLAAILPLTACASDSEDTSRNVENQPNGSKTIVVYFSCTNNTKGIAEKIAGVLGCDTWRIVPEQPYTSADLNYNNNSSRANREQNDPSARPAISGTIDLSNYDVVYVGYPIWWGKLPKILWTFFDAYDLSGKTIIPFCTSGSSGISTSVGEIKSLEPNATVIDGRRFDSNASESTIRTWVESVQPKTNYNTQNMKMNITVNGRTLTASLVENSSTAALLELLQKGSVTLDMHDYGNFEKVGDLPVSLPRNDEDITTQAGDLILYLGRSFVIYYDTNTWDFTRLGRIDNITQAELKQILGKGNVSVTLSLSNVSAVSSVKMNAGANAMAYRIDGTMAKADTKGIVIQNGKKVLR